MDDLKTQIDHIEAMVEDNRKMIKGIKRRGLYGAVVNGIKWVIILVLIFGSYYVASPYIQAIQQAYKDIQSAADSVKDFQEKTSFEKILSGIIPKNSGSVDVSGLEDIGDDGLIIGSEE